MGPLRSTLDDYREALSLFSRPARRFLLGTFLVWGAHGISSVLFNLYLVEGRFPVSFVGQTISMNGLGLALMALPAGVLADRWGRRRCLILGALLEGAATLVRVTVLSPAAILGASFAIGAGQSLYAIAAAPFIAEHSTPRERTYLFSAFFAVELLAGVAGSIFGGWMPPALRALPAGFAPSLLASYRATLVAAALFAAAGALPMVMLRGFRESAVAPEAADADRAASRKLWPIALNALLIGMGAGLVIPFMNLYFARRFQCSSGQIGLFFSVAQVATAAATLLGPALARRFGRLRTATASELLSLPFLVTLGAERRLDVAVGAFWLRAVLMQASTPLVNAFIMESLPVRLRARSASLSNTVWNAGWAASATLSGWVIQRFGYDVPFYVTAVLYATAAITFYLSFRGSPEGGSLPPLSEEARGVRGEGPGTE